MSENDFNASFITHLQELFQEHQHSENAMWMKKYLKNQFDFFGIKTPERKVLSKQAIQAKEITLEKDLKGICKLCFESPYREVQYFVGDLMYPILKKLDASYLELFHELIPQKAWWDSVDFLAPKLAGGLLLRFPEKMEFYADIWINSENIWYQRAGILFQLHYKKNTNATLLFENILKHATSKEFFVQKAAGWALREYSKTDAQQVVDFIENNNLPNLTVREGLKWINKKR